MELRELICRARAGDSNAFTELVHRYRNRAFAYAYVLLRDFQLAEDAAQEAFLAAYADLGRLQEPEAFPGWLRGIVAHQCGRIRRKRPVNLVPLEAVREIAASAADPELQWEAKESRNAVLAAVNALPQAQREVTTLYYIQEHSQQEIAAFLGIPVTTVNNRLHAARTRLKRRMLPMVKETLQQNALPSEFADRIGRIVQVRGGVVDARFAADATPEIYDALRIQDTVRQVEVEARVAQRLAENVVRCIVLSSELGLEPGMEVVRLEGQEHASLAGPELAQAVRTLGGAPPEPPVLLETGIKGIDLLCPFPQGGNVGLYSGRGVGAVVLIGELTRRLADHPQGLSLFKLSRKADVDIAQIGLVRDAEFLGQTDAVGKVQKFWLLADQATDPEAASEPTPFDAAVYLSPLLGVQGLWPAVDGLHSSSRLLTPETVGQEHCDLARRVRETLQQARSLLIDPLFLEYVAYGATQKARQCAQEFLPRRLAQLSAEERQVVQRARKLERFLTQPFFVAEPYTQNPGAFVPLAETLRGVEALLNGEGDDLPEEALLMVGTLEQAREKAATL
ncbi:MAG TPA: sigma-70 family RNA polymerase sigma factor [Chthonomonadaceae bacterium]|nr:sigma-70 family RNA polymerase sigma factor [Chthonomonadaceae bacterium]